MLSDYNHIRVPPAMAQKLQRAEAHGATEEQLEEMIREYLAKKICDERADLLRALATNDPRELVPPLARQRGS